MQQISLYPQFYAKTTDLIYKIIFTFCQGIVKLKSRQIKSPSEVWKPLILASLCKDDKQHTFWSIRLEGSRICYMLICYTISRIIVSNFQLPQSAAFL